MLQHSLQCCHGCECTMCERLCMLSSEPAEDALKHAMLLPTWPYQEKATGKTVLQETASLRHVRHQPELSIPSECACFGFRLILARASFASSTLYIVASTKIRTLMYLKKSCKKQTPALTAGKRSHTRHRVGIQWDVIADCTWYSAFVGRRGTWISRTSGIFKPW